MITDLIEINKSIIMANRTAILETQKGTIKFELFEKEAPITTKNFIDLTNKGFYNGLTFHRVEPGFVIQGGDPRGNGTGGSEKNIPLDRNYAVFGQVTQGIDVVQKIRKGDKILKATIQ